MALSPYATIIIILFNAIYRGVMSAVNKTFSLCSCKGLDYTSEVVNFMEEYYWLQIRIG